MGRLPFCSTGEMTKLQKGKIDQLLPEITRESRLERRRQCGYESNMKDVVTTRFPSVSTVAMALPQLSYCTVVLEDGTRGEVRW